MVAVFEQIKSCDWLFERLKRIKDIDDDKFGGKRGGVRWMVKKEKEDDDPKKKGKKMTGKRKKKRTVDMVIHI